MGHKHLAVIISAVSDVFLHLVDCFDYGIFLSSHLAVGDNSSLAVKVHYGANVEHGGHRRRGTRHASAPSEQLKVGGKELMVNCVSHRKGPFFHLFGGFAPVAKICRVVHKQAVAGAAAERVNHPYFSARMIFHYLFGRLICVVDRRGHARTEGDVKYFALIFLHKLFKKALVFKNVYLRGGGKIALIKQLVKIFQRIGIFSHIVLIFYSVHRVGIKQNGNFTVADILIRQVNRRFAG